MRLPQGIVRIPGSALSVVSTGALFLLLVWVPRPLSRPLSPKPSRDAVEPALISPGAAYLVGATASALLLRLLWHRIRGRAGAMLAGSPAALPIDVPEHPTRPRSVDRARLTRRTHGAYVRSWQ